MNDSRVRIAHERPAGGFELAAWLFMRLSGVALLVLALGHLVIMHMLHPIETVDYDFVAARWGHAFSGWRWYDLALLLLAMLHGVNGMRTIIDDHIHGPSARRLAHGILAVLGGGLTIIGTWAILLFQPVTP